MTSTAALSNRSNSSPGNNSSSGGFSLAPAWLKGPAESSPPAAAPKPTHAPPQANGHRATSSQSSMIQLGGSMGGGKLRNGSGPAGYSHHADSRSHPSQRPPSAGDFPSLDSASRTRTAGQPASKKNWKDAALAVDLAAANKDPVPAQEREREREKEREKEKLVNLVPKAPQPKKGGAHGKGAPPGKNPRDRDNRVKLIHEPPPPPPKPHPRSESPVSPSSSGGMVVLSLPKSTKADSASTPLRRSESAPPREASPVLLPAVSSAGSSPSNPNMEAVSLPSPTVSEQATGQRDVRQISPAGRTSSSLMQHFTSPPLDEAEEAEVPMIMAEEELRFMKELGWEDDGAEVAPLTSEEILQFKEYANSAPRTNRSLDEQRVLADRSLSEWAKRRVVS